MLEDFLYVRVKLWRMLSFLLILSLLLSSLASNNDVDSTNGVQNSTSPSEEGDGHNKIISLAESIRKSQDSYQKNRSGQTKNYWKETFAEIKALEVYFPKTAPFLNQWKTLLEENENGADAYTANATIMQSDRNDATSQITDNKVQPRARFDGFRSWDRLLQEWKYDVTEYIEKNTVNSGGYPMSTFGQTMKSFSKDDEKRTAKGDKNDDATSIETSKLSRLPEVELVGTSTSTLKQLPCPRPVQPHEEILPHTDLSDKSKSIWIVTTAALPWMTGTAVNPLLRAAYLTEGRSSAGGKVTLMLPWLEQVGDQERVYGKDRVFENPEDQETYIRTWLRDSANLKAASKELNIAWYTGRQERAENSIYSMGDITALIPVRIAPLLVYQASLGFTHVPLYSD